MSIMEQSCVLAVAGHMIDTPDRLSPRFPSSAEEAVRLEIRRFFAQLSPKAVICSAACGSDILFAEEAFACDIPYYVVLPFEDHEDFILHSVAHAGPSWVRRFDSVCHQASAPLSFVKAGGYDVDEDFKRNQYAVIFFALGFAAARNLPVRNLIVYDPDQPGSDVGGTDSFLKLTMMLKLKCDVIDLRQIRGMNTKMEIIE